MRKHLKVRNVEFLVRAFENFDSDARFDVTLSFANHSTYDGNTAQDLEQYLDRCKGTLVENGLLLFESHPPAYEGHVLSETIERIEERFEIMAQTVLDHGTFLDRGQTFIVARRRASV